MRSNRFLPAIAIAAVIVGVIVADGHARAPRVAASIKPIHAIVAAVMEGVASPDLIVKSAGSPHAYAMRPSEAKSLNRARLVVWVGEALETFLSRPLAAIAGKARVVTLMDIDGLVRLRAREGGDWDAPDHDAREGGGAPQFDAHVWLDPTNAKMIAATVAAALAGVDPANGAVYAANARRFADRIDALDAEMRALLAPVEDVPYMTFHDAFQYLEQHFGLGAIGAITSGPARKPGAKRLRESRVRIRDARATCVFGGPRSQPALLRAIVEGTGAKIGILDPLGAALEPGPGAYFALMRGLGHALRDCLEG